MLSENCNVTRCFVSVYVLHGLLCASGPSIKRRIMGCTFVDEIEIMLKLSGNIDTTTCNRLFGSTLYLIKLYRFLTVYMGSCDHEALADGLYALKPCI